jgi:dihydroorotase
VADAVVLRGGRVVDPANDVDGHVDVLIEESRIAGVGVDLILPEGVREVAVPDGCVVCPGLIDMHVHLREPGQEHKETVATGLAAAVAGGFTAVACMPNTEPANDEAGVTRLILERAADAGLARVYPIGAVSRGRAGEQLADLGELHEAGCVAVSDDGQPVASALLMRRALEYAGMFGMPVIDHCEDMSLADGGVAHEGFRSASLGLRGRPAVAEQILVERDIALACTTGAAVHIAHLSSRAAVAAVAAGKASGARVTCEVTPHHLALTDEELDAYDTRYKVNPPLRETGDREALVEAVREGVIDVIATDHAPHHYDEKLVEFDEAPFGVVGLETAVSVCLDRLVHGGVISLGRMVELMSVNPARILDVSGGGLSVGAPADLTLLAPDLKVQVDSTTFRSLGRNSPFDGRSFKGGVAATFVDGRAVFVNAAVSGADQLQIGA